MKYQQLENYICILQYEVLEQNLDWYNVSIVMLYVQEWRIKH